MNGGLVLQALATGLAAGSVYGLVGLGYGLIFRMSRVLNFAHGDLVTAAIFSLLLVLGGGAAVPAAGIQPALLGVGLVVALGFTAAAAVAIQRAAVAPFTGRHWSVGWIAGTLAAGLVLRSLAAARFPAESYSVPETLPARLIAAGGVVRLPGGGVLQAHAVLMLLVALVAAFGFDRWLSTSRTGRAMRASAEEPAAARLCGIAPERLQVLAWTLAGLLAALAGLLLAPTRPVTLDLGVVLALKGTAAAVLGRLGSARGTVLAGLALGAAESLATTLSVPGFVVAGLHLGPVGPLPGLQDVGPLLVLVLVLVAWPGPLRSAGEALD